jgi:hypothetical protein
VLCLLDHTPWEGFAVTTRSKLSDRFLGCAEDRSERHILEWKELLDTGPNSDPIDGVKWYALEDGTGVNRLPDGTYEIPTLGLRLRRVVGTGG